MSGMKMQNRIVEVFLVSILGIFPLVFHDYYFDILPAKYMYYYITTLAMAALVMIMTFLRNSGSEKKKMGDALRSVSKKLWWSDWALLAFLAAATISTLCSKYVSASFWGNEGRLTGLFLLLVYGIGYFCISRCWKFRGFFLNIFLFSGMLACLFGITDYFKMDLLGFKEHMVDGQKTMFTSTIGNINSYTAYVALIVAISAVLFSTAEKTKQVIGYAICLMISILALMMGNSDNAYLSLLTLFGCLPLYLFGVTGGMKRYLAILAIFLTSIQMIDWINQRFDTIGIDGLFGFLARFDYLLLCVAIAWFLVLFVFALKKKYPDKIWISARAGRITWFCLLFAGFLVVIFMLADANVLGHADRYAAFENYLVFNDQWGTNRGAIWRMGMENYMQFPWCQKLFGYGLETFAILLLENNKQEMWNMGGVLYDNAHNEYLQYLITMGAAGLVAYLMFIVSSAVQMIQKSAKNPYVMAIVFALLCYWAQALVNINLPIVAPFMWSLLPMGFTAERVEDDDVDAGSGNGTKQAV